MEVVENNIRKRSARVNDRQIKIMVNYMCDHITLACGRFQGSQGKAIADKQWKQLKCLLSEHGPSKTVEQWKKVWKDLKSKSRAKKARINAERSRTGNVSLPIELNDIEEKVLSVIGSSKSVPLFDGVSVEESDPMESFNKGIQLSSLTESKEGRIENGRKRQCEETPPSTCHTRRIERGNENKKRCKSKLSSLLEGLESINEKVEGYEMKQFDMQKEVLETLREIRNSQTKLVVSQEEIASSLSRIAASLETMCGRMRVSSGVTVADGVK